MARTKPGRAKVAEWLKYTVNITTRSGNEPMARYSFTWMWEEIGGADLRR